MNLKGNVYKVVKYWDTHPESVWKQDIKTLDEAKEVVKNARKKEDYRYDFYVFDERGVKVT